MTILLDTNILIRLANPDDPDHRRVITIVDRLHQNGEELAVVPQCLYEFHVVATRPASRNGLGLSFDEALRDADEFLRKFTLLDPEIGLFSNWRQVILTYQTIGKPAHDARLIAAMRLHSLKHLLTFNVTDFQRYSQEITLLDPMTM